MKAEKNLKILVVEDDPYYKKLLEYDLSLNPDNEVIVCSNGKECLARLKEKPDLITLDFRLPDMDGIQLLKKIREVNEDVKVIMISSQDDIEVVVDLLKMGVYDYIVKAPDIRQRLLKAVNTCRVETDLKSKIGVLQSELGKKYEFQNSIIGKNESLLKVFELMEKAIKANIVVSITGETGTGKELVAKAIHYNSPRKNGTFVAMNIAAIPSELIESELFGYEKGSFTGAMQRRIGKFEEADGGTLFLDEIGEMDLNVQVKLLRVLQEKEVTRIGNNKPIKIDARIIVATNRNLSQMVKEGTFREDLFFRLLGISIDLPPLRERGNDILILADYFLKNFTKENALPPITLSESAQKKLLAYHFPGNIRELKSIIELAALLSNQKEILDTDITLQNNLNPTDMMSTEMTMRDYSFKILESFLRKYNNNISLVAEKLDISQATIYRMLKELKES